MSDPIYTAEILRERADLRTRRPTRIQLQNLAKRYHGKNVRSVGIVRDVETVRGPSGTELVRVTAYDEQGGEEIRYDVSADFAPGSAAGADRGQFERWSKGQKVIVEGRLEWPDAEVAPVVDVTTVRFS